MYIGYALEEGQAPHNSMAAFWLAMSGNYVRYLAISRGSQPEWIGRINNLEYERIPLRPLLGVATLLFKILKIMLQRKPDWVYIQGAQQAAALLPLCAMRLLPRTIYHTQDFKPVENRFYRFAEKFVSRKAHLVVCNELNRARCMALLYDLKEIPRTLRTALPKDWPDPIAKEEVVDKYLVEKNTADKGATARRYIVAGGPYRPERRKSNVLLEALALLPAEYAVVFTGMEEGSASLDECRQKSFELDIADRVFALPRLDYQNLLSLFLRCHIGMLLYCDSDIANFYQGPGRLTEYLRAQLPVVASNHPGLELIVLKHQIGQAVNANSPSDIANAIVTADIEFGERNSEMRRRLYQLSKGDLSYEHDAFDVFPSDMAKDSVEVSRAMANAFS